MTKIQLNITNKSQGVSPTFNFEKKNIFKKSEDDKNMKDSHPEKKDQYDGSKLREVSHGRNELTLTIFVPIGSLINPALAKGILHFWQANE